MDTCVSLGYKKPKKVADWQSYEYHSFKAPWLSKRYQHFINNISWAALFSEINPNLGGNVFSKSVFKFLSKDAEFRFQHKMFRFAPEFGIVNNIYRRKLSSG
jgi:hypothetical protein